MGILDRLRWSGSVLTDAHRQAMDSDSGASFAVDAAAIDPAVFGLTSYASPTSPAPRIDRRAAIQVPAVKRCRDLIAGSLGSLPLALFNARREQLDSTLLAQPERSVPRTVTMTRTIEDMLFEGIAWWRITEPAYDGYPLWVERVEPRRVEVSDGKVYIDGVHVSDDKLIRFDSPNDGLLTAGARAIRTALALDSAASRYADEPVPLGYFTPEDPEVEPDETEVTGILDAWSTARQTRATGYVPGALKYVNVQMTPEQMQLASARQHAVLEIARVAGVDAEELGVSTTSRTYANMFERRKSFLDFTLGGYMAAIQDRLSMGDVTVRGQFVKFNLDAFLRSDTLARYQAYAAGLAVGALDREEIRELEDKPALTTAPAAPEETTNVRSIAASRTAGPAFDTEPAMVLDAPGAQAFQVDTAKRTIRGLAVPYGVPARSGGQLWQFSRGSLKWSDVSRVKLWIQHDQDRAVGVATALEDTDEGLLATFKVARGAAGDEALSYAEDGVLDGLSIGLGVGGRFKRTDGINHAIEAPVMEVSLTPAPAFDDARVHAVAASATLQEGTTVFTEEELARLRAAGIDPSNVTAAREWLNNNPAAATFTATAPGPDFSAVTDGLAQAVRDGFAALQSPQRETVSASAEVVREELPYRFDGLGGRFGFLDDIRLSASGHSEATHRLETFMGEAFAVTTTNAAALNPTPNRPELYVPNLSYTRPLWDLVSTGTVDDKTPFTIPKFSSATGLVAAHVEGVEPTPGAFTATSQTVSPSPVSGKVEINREVWDQGGNPKTDAIVWGEMLNGYYEALEAKIATMLNGLSLTETNLAGAVDEALVDAVQNIFVDLQYVRGGNRYTALALDGLFFKALVNASDTSGRKLLPVIGAQNAQGDTSGGFDRVAIGSQSGVAAWALGAANSSHSYLFVPSSVWAWASAPKRFTFEYQVKSIDMAIWGYSASAVLRDSDVKRIDYTTADV